MNATFSIHRLGLTVYKELQEKYMPILTSTGIILMTYLAIWALNLIDGEPVAAGARASSAATILNIIGCLAPFFLYKNENRRMEGVFYAFSSKEYLNTITSFLQLNTDPMAIDFVNRMFDTMIPLAVPPIVGLALTQSAFVLLNMLFRRHKIGYTLLTLLGIWVIAIVIVVISAVSVFDNLQNNPDINPERIYQWLITLYKAAIVFCTYILPIACWILTYFRIRRIQY